MTPSFVSDEPLFSVLVANYNNGRYLQEAIASVQRQTYRHWEIVVVDDGSTDNSKELYDVLKTDRRIRIFFNEDNCGCGFAKWRCAEEARGTYSGFLDPDDTLEPEAIAEMVNAFKANPVASLIYSTHYLRDEHLNHPSVNTAVQTIPEGESYLSVKNQKISIAHFAAFVTEKYRTTVGIDPTLKRAVDQDLYYKMEETGEVVYLPLPLYNYRRHSGGISTDTNVLRARYWHAMVMKAAYWRRRKMGTPKNIHKSDLNRYISQYYLWKAMEKMQLAEKCKALHCLWKSFIHSPADNNFAMRLKVLAGIIRSKRI